MIETVWRRKYIIYAINVIPFQKNTDNFPRVKVEIECYIK